MIASKATRNWSVGDAQASVTAQPVNSECPTDPPGALSLLHLVPRGRTERWRELH
jgi:hypothetical protein